MNLDHMPKPPELMDNPQLAIVIALETTLVAAMRSLLAAHPEIYDDEFPRTITESDFWVDRMTYLGCQLQEAIAKYRFYFEDQAAETEPTTGNEDF
jgi:hypothetical protein